MLISDHTTYLHKPIKYYLVGQFVEQMWTATIA